MPTRPPSLTPRRPTPAVPTRDRRESAAARGYGPRWQRYRAVYLAAHPLCVRCQSGGRVAAASLIDHIHPIAGEADPLFWDPDNHQPLCRRCHAIKTGEDRGAGLTRNLSKPTNPTTC